MWKAFGCCNTPVEKPFKIQYRIIGSKGEEKTRGYFEPEFDTCPMGFIRSDIWPQGVLAAHAAGRALVSKKLERETLPAKLYDLVRLLDYENHHRINTLQDARMSSITNRGG